MHPIYRYRLAFNLTRPELAKMVGVTMGAIKLIENGGGMKAETCIAIAEAFDVAPGDLLDEIEEWKDVEGK